MSKAWSEYTFSGERGPTRFQMFLKDLEAAGGEVREDIKAQILERGWSEVYRNGKNFASLKARHRETGEPASVALHARGNPEVLFDMSTMIRLNTRGSETLSTEAKEVLFLALLQVAMDAKKFTTPEIQKATETLNQNLLAGYIGNVYGASDPAKLAEEILTKRVGIAEAAQGAANFFSLGLSVAGYELHRESKLIKQLREAGSKLSGLGKDKWNPSDVYLIKDPAKVSALLSLREITTFNKAYSDLVQDRTILPVSLKVDAKAAMGAISTRRYADIKGPVAFEESQISSIVQEMKAIQRKCRCQVFASLNKDTSLGRRGNFKSVSSFLGDPAVQEELAKNVAWSRCYPPVLVWMNSLKGSIPEVLALCLMEAMSASPLSTGFYLVAPAEAKWKVPGGVEIEVKAVEFQINTTSVLIHYTLTQGEKISDRTAQIRTKGSVPQIITYDTVRGGGAKVLTIS